MDVQTPSTSLSGVTVVITNKYNEKIIKVWFIIYGVT